MACPRPIEGSAGSRIKLVLGEKGSDYILIVNEDRGDREVQSILGEFEGGISSKLSKQIKDCNANDFFVKDVASGHDGEWYLEVRKKSRSTAGNDNDDDMDDTDDTDDTNDNEKDYGEREQGIWGGLERGLSDEIKSKYAQDSNLKVAFGDDNRWVLIQSKNGFHYSGNLDPKGVNIAQRLRHLNEINGTIHFVRLLPNGGYFIQDSKGHEGKGIPSDLAKEIEKKSQNDHDALVDIVHTKTGGWVILNENSFSCSQDISSSLSSHLAAFYRNHKKNCENREKLIRRYKEERERVIREYKNNLRIN